MLEKDNPVMEDLVEKIVSYKGKGSLVYIEKFSKKWISNIIEESDAIQLIEKKFQEHEQKGLDIYAFIRVFLNILPHTEDETLYITIALIDLFRSICDAYNLDKFVTSSDILNYIVENFINQNNKLHIIQTRKLPDQKKFNAEPGRVREIDLEAPVILGDVENNVKRLNKNKIISDSTHHNNNGIKKACFGAEVKKIFTLDSLADNICIFNLNCILEKKIVPKPLKQYKDVMILDFAWSNSQQRIGATFKDLALSFWEANDNYEFEKNFSIASISPEYQLKIWYIEFLSWWITTDKTHSIHVWDIEKETCVKKLDSPIIQGNIVDIVPLEVVKLVAVGSLDKIITIWNFHKGRVLMKLEVPDGGVHTMVWSNIYQVLLTVGYENKIKVWDVNQTSQDTSMIGKLVGHPNPVVGLEFIEASPIVVSADNAGHIKVWDIRNLTCVQTLNVDVSTITKLIDISKHGKVAFIGNRINLLDFEEAYAQLNPLKKQEHYWPIKADYDPVEDQLILCTRKDVRFVDAYTGRIRKVYIGLLKEGEADITNFKMTQQNKNFILGDDRGNINVYNTLSGEYLKSLAPHQNEITALKYDFSNNLIISAGGDCQIHIQKETKLGYDLQRSIKNLHFNKEAGIMEVSVYHNMILTASNTNCVYAWDYEYAKLLAQINLKQDSEATALYFINGFSIIIIADVGGKLQFLLFKRRDTTFISFTKIAEIDIFEDMETPPSNEFANRILVDIDEKESQDLIEYCKLYISTNKGEIKIYDILKIIQHQDVKQIAHANSRSSYNCHRILEENFLTAIGTYKLPIFELSSIEKSQPFVTSEHHAQPLLVLNNTLIKEFKAHNDSLTGINITILATKRLVTTSLDLHIKIWTLEGDLLGALNINYPLPTVWDLGSFGADQHRKKIFYALKVLDNILKKNKKEIFMDEEKRISVNKFLTFLNTGKADFRSEPHGALSPEIRMVEQEEAKKKKVVLMKEEYSPRDIQFEKVKHIYKKEIQGHTLKQMDFSKRIAATLQTSNSRAKEIALKKIEEEEKFEKMNEETKMKQEFVSFLIEEARNAMFEQKEYSDGITRLSNNLDFALRAQHNQNNCNNEKSDLLLMNQRSQGTLQRMRPARGRISHVPTLQIAEHSLGNPVTLEDTSLTLHGNMSSMASSTKAMPSILSFSSKAQSTKNQDFYLYAKRKIELEDQKSSLPSLSGSVSKKDYRSEAFDRKLKKKNFHEILNKLDEKRKRSQLTSTHYSRTSLASTAMNVTPAVDHPKMTQYTSKPVETNKEKEEPLLRFIERSEENKRRKPFHEELKELKKFVQGSWDMDEEDSKTKVVFKNIQRKIAQGEQDINSVENPARKVRPMLRDLQKSPI